MAEHTLGRRILNKQPVIRVFGEEVPLRAQVEVLNGYSAHGDRRDLREWIQRVRGKGAGPRTVFLVHGEAEALEALASGGVVLDTRAPETFALGHLRGSINVGLDGRFAEYTGTVIRRMRSRVMPPSTVSARSATCGAWSTTVDAKSRAAVVASSTESKSCVPAEVPKVVFSP